MIGVVIPALNAARWIGEALDSIERQTPRPTEVVVVDSGCTDDTVAIVRARGVRVVPSAGTGAGASRDTGARLLGTPLLAFLDADDRFTPRHHQVLLGLLRDPAVDVARGRVTQFAQGDAATRFAVPTGSMPGSHVGAIVLRRAVYEAVGGFPTDPTRHETFDFFSGLGEHGARFADADAIVLERRIHGENLTITNADDLRARYLASARAAIERRRRSAP